MESTVKIAEVFKSIQGETRFVGVPCSFVRLSGCNLACRYCDTEYARGNGEPRSVLDVMREVAGHHTDLVCVTGGEPLLQQGAHEVIRLACDREHIVLVETNGSLDIGAIDGRAIRILDIKSPGSGEDASSDLENLRRLRRTDELKLVLCDRRDYEWAKKLLAERFDPPACVVTLSPAREHLAPADLADWILRDRLHVRLGVQLHKVIWPGAERGR